MLRQSLIAAAVAVATITSSASIGFAQTQTPTHHRAVVHHPYTYEPARTPYYGSYYDPYYYGYGPYYYGHGPYYYGYSPYYYGPSPVAPVANAAGAAACLAFSLIGAC
jgi:hypothetical protein